MIIQGTAAEIALVKDALNKVLRSDEGIECSSCPCQAQCNNDADEIEDLHCADVVLKYTLFIEEKG